MLRFWPLPCFGMDVIILSEMLVDLKLEVLYQNIRYSSYRKVKWLELNSYLQLSLFPKPAQLINHIFLILVTLIRIKSHRRIFIIIASLSYSYSFLLLCLPFYLLFVHATIFIGCRIWSKIAFISTLIIILIVEKSSLLIATVVTH